MEHSSTVDKDASSCILYIQPVVQKIASSKNKATEASIDIKMNKGIDIPEKNLNLSDNSVIDLRAMQQKNNLQALQKKKEHVNFLPDKIQKKGNTENRCSDARQTYECAPVVCSLDQLIDNEPSGESDGRQNSQENASHSLQDLESVENSEIQPPGATNGAAENQPESNNQGGNTEMERLLQSERIIYNSYKSKLRRILVSFAATFLGTFFVPYITTEEADHRTLFIILYVGIGYYFLEMFSRVFTKHNHRWQMLDDFFKSCDVLCLLTFFILFDINLSTGFRMTKIALIPHFVFGTFAHFSTSAPPSIREPQTAFRVFFGVQLLLVTLKLDQDIEWSWKITLCLVWFYFGMIIFYFVVLSIIFIAMGVMAFLKKKVYQDLDLSTQIFGHFWHLCYVGYGVIAFAVLVLTTIVLEDEFGVRMLRTSVYVARYAAIFMVVYTLIISNTVIVFLRRINKENELAVEDLPALEGGKRLVKVEIENKMVHLVKMSSTYFLPLKDSFIQKDKGHLKKLKKSVIDLKGKKEMTPEKRSTIKSSITVEDLKKDQKVLEKKLQNVARQSTGSQKKIEKTEEISLDLHRVYNHTNEKEGDIIKNRQTICLSEGDQDLEYQEISEIDQENENNCYICVQNRCNAVIMNCGHGGVCYDCALEFVMKKNQCMQCRQEVDRVIKINPDPKLRNIIKGYEETKVVFE